MQIEKEENVECVPQWTEHIGVRRAEAITAAEVRYVEYLVRYRSLCDSAD